MARNLNKMNDVERARRAGWFAALAGGALVAVGLGLATCSPEQAEIRCQAVPDAQSWMNFVGQYVPTAPTTGTCDEVVMPLGESLYLFTFSPAGDGKINSQGIKSGPMGEAIAAAEEAGAFDNMVGLEKQHASVAVGQYTSKSPDSNGVCKAPTFSEAVTDIPAYTIEEEDTESEFEQIDNALDQDPEADTDTETDTEGDDDDDGEEEVPALVQIYKWSNFRVYVTPEQIGMQFDADLQLTINGCTGAFHVQAVVPEIDCGATDENEEPVVDLNGVQIPDDAICTDPDTLINNMADPNIALKCVNLSTDPTWAAHRCVPAKPFPSLR